MAKIEQEKAIEVESLAKVYTTNSTFAEPFLRVTFLAINDAGEPEGAILDINGPVPLPANVPITFDCKGMGKNVTHFTINIASSRVSVMAYWTKYRGFVWGKES